MKKIFALSVTTAAVLAAGLSSTAFAASDAFSFSTAVSGGESKLRPSAGVASDTQLNSYSLSVGYKATNDLSFSGNYLRSNSKIARTDGVITKTEADTFGVTSIYKINKSVTAFGNYSHTAVDVGTRGLPGGSFVDFDLNINLFLAGVTLAKVVDNKYLFTLTPTVSYADSDIDDYLVRTGNTPVAGSKNSVTTFSLTPSASYIHGKGVYGISYTQNHKNSGDDLDYGKAKISASYNLNKSVNVGVSYAQDVARDDIDGNEFGVNLKVKI